MDVALARTPAAAVEGQARAGAGPTVSRVCAPRAARPSGPVTKAPLIGRDAEAAMLASRLHRDGRGPRAPQRCSSPARPASGSRARPGADPRPRVRTWTRGCCGARASLRGRAASLATRRRSVRIACGVTDGDVEVAIGTQRTARSRASTTRALALSPGVTDRLLGLIGFEDESRPGSDGPPSDPELAPTAELDAASTLRGFAARDRCSSSSTTFSGRARNCSTPSARSPRGCGSRSCSCSSDVSRRRAATCRPRQVHLAPLDEGTADRLLRAYLGVVR